jgi:hypothetical protein
MKLPFQRRKQRSSPQPIFDQVDITRCIDLVLTRGGVQVENHNAVDCVITASDKQGHHFDLVPNTNTIVISYQQHIKRFSKR